MTSSVTLPAAARALEVFEQIEDLIQKGSLKVSPSSLVADHAENWVVYTNGITVAIGLAKRENVALCPPHCNDVIRVVTVARGNFTAHLPGKKLELGPGDTLQIPANTIHTFVAKDAGAKLVSVYMPKETTMSRLFGKLFKHMTY